MTQEEIALNDAHTLGLLPPSVCPPTPEDADPHSPFLPAFGCPVSSFQNPFPALAIALSCLSNNHGIDGIGSFLGEVFSQLSKSMIKALISLDCPTIRAARFGILKWADEQDDRELFLFIAELTLRDELWVEHHPRLAGELLLLAARFGSREICQTLLNRGVPPDLRFQTWIGEGIHSPLLAACMRGNTEVTKLLLDAGVPVNRRYGSLTVAGRLLQEMKQSSVSRSGRLQAMELLLLRGSDVSEAFLESFDFHKDPSANTLLDEAMLTRDEEITSLFIRYDSEHGIRTLRTTSGLILSSLEGALAVKRYLNSSVAPRLAEHWSKIHSFAIKWLVERELTDPIANLVQAGISVDSIRGLGHNVLTDLISDSPLSAASSRLAILILRNHRGNLIEDQLISRIFERGCREHLELLFGEILREGGTDLERALIMALAARYNNFQAVSMLHGAPFNISFDAMANFGKAQFSALLLSIATVKRIKRECRFWHLFQLDSRFAGEKMLDLFVRNGADISTCQPKLCLEELMIKRQPFHWLITNGLPLPGASIYGLLFSGDLCSSRTYYGDEGQRTNAKILQSLVSREVRLFSPDESECLHRGELDNPLAYFISLKPGPQFIQRVLDASASLANGRPSFRIDEKPLMEAILVDDCWAVEKLISLDVFGDKSEQNHKSQSSLALILACGESSRSGIPRHYLPEIVKLLLNHGANPNVQLANSCCYSLLHTATEPWVIDLLLAYGADPNKMIRAHLKESRQDKLSCCFARVASVLSVWPSPYSEIKWA